MNKSETNKYYIFKKRLSPIKYDYNIDKINYYSESKREENSSQSFLNSMRYMTTFEESCNESRRKHIIKNPYKIGIPIRSNIKKIKKSRLLSLNNFYKKTLKNNLLIKDILANDSTNYKMNTSKEELKKTPMRNSVLKSTINISALNQTKNMNTEGTSSTKELTNPNASNNSRVNKYNKYKIFSYKHNINKTNSFRNNYRNNKIDEFRTYRFISLNEGRRNLPNIKTGMDFIYEIKNIFKEKYISLCLKEKETEIKACKENNDENYIIDMKKKKENRKLLEIFIKEFNTYFKRLKIQLIKDKDYIRVLKWHILSYKSDVNRLNIRKDKLLAKLNKYIKMKHFLIKMRNYSLDKKDDDSWMFKNSNRSAIMNYNGGNDLIKENRRIKETEESEESFPKIKKFQRRGSVNLQDYGKLNEIMTKITPDKNKQTNRKELRTNSLREKNPLIGSQIREISTILNNHIANLLIYQNELRIDLEPLKEEFKETYNSLKKSEERQNELLKLQFLILPEKKRILKDRNEFLTNTLININNNLYNSTKYNKANDLIHEKLNNIYKLLLDNKIINYIPMKTSIQDNIVERILYFLKHIEKGIVTLDKKKEILKKDYPELYMDVLNQIKEQTKVATLKKQRQMRLKFLKHKARKIVDKMEKSLILNKRQDFYQYGYKRHKKKIKPKVVDPYEELRYSDDNEENKEKGNIK
jgi:hypothetical protein